MNRRSALYEIAHLLGDPALTTIPDIRDRHPGISAAYPKLGLDELADLIDRLKQGETFPAPRKPPRPFTARELEVLAIIKAWPHIRKISAREIGRRLKPVVSGQAVGRIIKSIERKNAAGLCPSTNPNLFLIYR